MSKLAWAGGIALAAIFACGEAGAQTPIPPAPKDFAMDASQSDQFEILCAKVALIESQNPRVRSFAEDMIRDHTRLGEELRQAVAAAGMKPLPPSLSGDQARLLASLQGLRGADFDKTYARQQELAHTQAVDVEESFAAAGADPNLRKAAQSALPVIKDHLKRAKGLLAGS